MQRPVHIETVYDIQNYDVEVNGVDNIPNYVDILTDVNDKDGRCVGLFVNVLIVDYIGNKGVGLKVL